MPGVCVPLFAIELHAAPDRLFRATFEAHFSIRKFVHFNRHDRLKGWASK